jgi:hypothetical protein
LNLGQEVVEDEDGGRVNGDDQRPGDQADGVEEIHDLKGHETCYHGKDKDTIAEPSKWLIAKTLGPLLFPEENSIEEIDRTPHGAEPSTKEIAKDENEKEHPEAREHPQNELLLCEDRDDSDEGIEPKVEIDGDLHLEWKGGPKDQIEKEAKGKGLNRPSRVSDQACHVALTFFTRTLERSISPNPNS